MEYRHGGVAGNWNAAFESFFSSTGGIVPDKAELMIWIDSQGPFNPGGSLQRKVSIGGLNWNLYHQSSWSSWEHYITYELVAPASSVGLDLEDFLTDSLSRGYLQPDWYMDNMEPGFEIWSDGEGLKTTSFSAQINPVPEPVSFVIGVLYMAILAGHRRHC